jgi:hypothetical protein
MRNVEHNTAEKIEARSPRGFARGLASGLYRCLCVSFGVSIRVSLRVLLGVARGVSIVVFAGAWAFFSRAWRQK